MKNAIKPNFDFVQHILKSEEVCGIIGVWGSKLFGKYYLILTLFNTNAHSNDQVDVDN